MTKGCVMTLNQGHISKIKVIVYTWHKFVFGLIPFTSNFDGNDISHNCCPWPRGCCCCGGICPVRTCLFIDEALLSFDNSCLLLCNHYMAFNKIWEESSTTHSSVCIFRTCVTKNGHPGLLFAYSFWLLRLYFWDLCVNKNGHHGLSFAYTFVIFPLQLLHRFFCKYVSVIVTVGNFYSLITGVQGVS